MKVAIDRHVATGQLDGLGGLAILYCALLVAAFAAEYLQTWTMQLTGQRIMFDLRMSIYGHLQRLDIRYFDRNPVGRLMTRVTSDVDVLNDLFTSGVVTIFSDMFALARHHGDHAVDELAARACHLSRAAVDRDRHPVVPAERARVVPRGSRLDRADQRVPAGEHHRDVDRSAVPARSAELPASSTTSTRSIATRTSSGVFYYAVFYPAIEAIAALATALIIWYGGASVLGGTLTLGALVAFVQYSQRFFRPISDMSEKFNVLQSAMASSERIFKLLDEPVAIESPRDPHRPPMPKVTSCSTMCGSRQRQQAGQAGQAGRQGRQGTQQAGQAGQVGRGGEVA